MDLLCVPHELAEGRSAAASTIIAGMSVCRDCMAEVAVLIESGYTGAAIIAKFAAEAPDPDDLDDDGFQ